MLLYIDLRILRSRVVTLLATASSTPRAVHRRQPRRSSMARMSSAVLTIGPTADGTTSGST